MEQKLSLLFLLEQPIGKGKGRATQDSRLAECLVQARLIVT